jgi:hypothetical protein
LFQALPARRPGWLPDVAPRREQGTPEPREENQLSLVVEDSRFENGEACLTPLLDGVQAALAEAGRRQRLPDDYLDVTEGLLAGWKRRIKRKLLGNFKHAYVDVLSRQQSTFNQFIMTALQELADCCATLDHARRFPAGAGSSPGLLRGEAATFEERLARLEARLAELEVAAGGLARQSR